MRETHIGVVFLLGDHAYKMKKPVTTAFLDFSTPQRRLAACRREVELNRRLAPDVYLGVSGVSGAELPPWAGRGADGAPVEHLVVMRRMPDDRRLSTLVRAGAPVRDHLRDLARSVAAFHAAARRDPDVTAEGSRDALGARWAANIEQVRAQCSRAGAGDGRRGGPAGRPVPGRPGSAVRRPVRRRPDRRRPRRPHRRRRLLPRRRPARPGLPGVRRQAPLRRRPRRRGVPRHGPGAARPARPRRRLAGRLRRVLRRPRTGGPAPPLRRLPRLRPRQGRVPAPPAGRRRRGDGRGAVRRPQPAASRGRSRAARAGRGAARHGQDHRRPGRWPTGSARCCSPATGCARNSPASPPPSPPPPPTARASTPPNAPTRSTRSCCTGPRSSSSAASRWCSTRRGRTRGTARPPRNWPGVPTATWSAWSAASLPTSPAARLADPRPHRLGRDGRHRACDGRRGRSVARRGDRVHLG